MFFSQLGRIAAFLVLLLGVLRVVTGLLIANEWMLPYEEALTRYTTMASSGEVIDQGIYAILLGIALGMLAEIRIALREE